MNFALFRKWVGAKIKAPAKKSKLSMTEIHIKRMRKVMLDVDYEGPELFSGTSEPPHALYENMLENLCDYDDDKEMYWEEHGIHAIGDWLVDFYPSLVDLSLSKEIRSYLA